MKKLHKTVIQIEVLSEDFYDFWGLESLARDIILGECSGLTKIVSQEELTHEQSILECQKQGTDPEFFQLTGE